jgi:hypothetical protein
VYIQLGASFEQLCQAPDVVLHDRLKERRPCRTARNVRIHVIDSVCWRCDAQRFRAFICRYLHSHLASNKEPSN